MQKLSGYWSDFFKYCHRPPYIHREDDEPLRECLKDKQPLFEPLTFERYVKSQRFGPEDEDFHFSLLPVPYAGNLEKADVFILLLNPGFSPVDYYAEYKNRDFELARRKNLEQDFSRSTEYPFLYLNPRFCWHGGYRWWESKLRRIVQAVAEKQHNGSYLDALKAVSKRIASVELVPYHSVRFKSGARMMDLPSARAAKSWVLNSLVPRAKKGEAVIVITRKIGVWDIRPIRGRIVCYDRFEARAAHLTASSRGGRAILKQLRS